MATWQIFFYAGVYLTISYWLTQKHIWYKFCFAKKTSSNTMSTILKLFCYFDLFFYYTDYLFSCYSTAVGQNYVNHSFCLLCFCYLRCNAFDRPINKVYVWCLFEKFTHRLILQEFYTVYQNSVDRSGKYSLGGSFIEFFLNFKNSFVFFVDISLCNSEYINIIWVGV